MKRYKVEYKNSVIKIIIACSALDVIKQLDLCTRENLGTKITELKELRSN